MEQAPPSLRQAHPNVDLAHRGAEVYLLRQGHLSRPMTPSSPTEPPLSTENLI